MGSADKRDKWGGQLDFILSCLGYAVGLGNVWRFPYLCGRNGGAAFLIPYVIMMIFAGLPTFYLELAIGQYAALTPHMLYRKMCPIFTGIGYAMVTASVFTGVYYNMIIAWAVYYFVASFSFTRLPWDGCGNDFNTKLCYDDRVVKQCANATPTQWYFNGACYNQTQQSVEWKDVQYSQVEVADLLKLVKGINGTDDTTNRTTSAKEYNDYVLGISDGIENFGYPKWDLLLCLAFAWVLIFFCLIKGVKSSGKVVYFTATFPYLLLLILFFRGITLDGAGDGIRFYLIPQWEYLIKSEVWAGAAIQIFFSLSLGGGGLTTLASYNEFNNNLLRDTLIVVFGNCGTSLFAGFVIFPIIGFVANQTGQSVSSLAASGPTLAFAAYPDALTRLSPSWLWSIMFFFMLVLLGIDSQLVIVEVVITAIIDQWPALRATAKKVMVVGAVSIAMFICGIPLTCPGGPYLLNLLDTFAGGWTLVMACLAEVCMVSWVYGLKRFIKDIELMLGKPPNTFWRLLGYPSNIYWWVCWVALTPLLLTGVLLFSWFDYQGLTYGDYVYPLWAEVCGWSVALLCVMWIPGVALYYYIVAQVPHCGLFKWLVEPTDGWKPAIDDDDNEYSLRPMGNQTISKAGSLEGGQSNQAYAHQPPQYQAYSQPPSEGWSTPQNRF